MEVHRTGVFGKIRKHISTLIMVEFWNNLDMDGDSILLTVLTKDIGKNDTIEVGVI